MNPHQLIYTALLLGAFVLSAGGYAILFTLGRLHQASQFVTAARFCFALQVLASGVIVVSTPLGIGWKLLICASCAATLRIPSITWRYLDLIHAHQ